MFRFSSNTVLWLMAFVVLIAASSVLEVPKLLVDFVLIGALPGTEAIVPPMVVVGAVAALFVCTFIGLLGRVLIRAHQVGYRTEKSTATEPFREDMSLVGGDERVVSRCHTNHGSWMTHQYIRMRMFEMRLKQSGMMIWSLLSWLIVPLYDAMRAGFWTMQASLAYGIARCIVGLRYLYAQLLIGSERTYKWAEPHLRIFDAYLERRIHHAHRWLMRTCGQSEAYEVVSLVRVEPLRALRVRFPRHQGQDTTSPDSF